MTINDVLSQIAAKTPTPGGGAVAPIVAGLAAALAEMVLRYSDGKQSLAVHETLHRKAIGAMEEFRTRALNLANADASVYGDLNALWKLDPSDPIRKAGWADAVAAAIDVPMRVVGLCNELLDLIDQLIGKTSKLLDSDLAIAAVLAESAARAAAWSVRMNLPLLEDSATRQAAEVNLERALSSAQNICAKVEGGIQASIAT